MNKNFILLGHPLIKRDMTIFRDKNTDSEIFRSALKRVSNILAVEISKSFRLTEIEIETPLEKTKGYKVDQDVILFRF